MSNLKNLQVHRLGELLKMEFPQTNSLLGNDLLDRSGAMLISGPQKIGKSLFASQLGLSLADRKSFVGFECSTSRRVLMLQAEVGERRMQQRFQRQVATFSEDVHSNLYNACTFSMLKLDDPDGAAFLMEMVEQYKPDVVVIDPMANFHSGDENVVRDVIRVTSKLDEIRALGSAVILVHHHGKASTERSNVGHKARGSTALPGWYDTHLSLEKADKENKKVRLKFELRNGETPEDMLLRLNPETMLFEAQSDEAAQLTLVVSAVRDLGPSTAEDVGECCSHTRQWASEWLNRAVEKDMLQRNGDRPVIFSLPGQPAETRVNVTPDGIVVSTNTGHRVVVNEQEVVDGTGVFMN